MKSHADKLSEWVKGGNKRPPPLPPITCPVCKKSMPAGSFAGPLDMCVPCYLAKHKEGR